MTSEADPLLAGLLTSSPGALDETTGFLEHGGEQVYVVLHSARGPRRSSIILAGPLGIERERAYPTVVRWARRLAASNCDVLRFDYRGTGESSGRFAEMTTSDWKADLSSIAALLRRRAPNVPLILHGIRFGAILASEVFVAGEVDGLLLWAAPRTLRHHFMEAMRRNYMSEMVLLGGAPPQTRDEYVADLESGKRVNIEGYMWTRELWMESAQHSLMIPSASEQRPWQRIESASLPAAGDSDHVSRVPMVPFWDHQALMLPECEPLFQASIRWLSSWNAAGEESL